MENKIMLRIQQILVPVVHNDQQVVAAIASKLGCSQKDIISWKKISQSIDARKDRLTRVISVACQIQNPKKYLTRGDVSLYQPVLFTLPICGHQELFHRPIIVGMGPAGLFCALLLSEMGYRPYLLEQGQPVEQRTKDVNQFWQDGVLNPLSNVQFGEGGAGTFSDGKLTSRSKDPLNDYVLAQLVKFGADEAILYEKYPHLGSDQLIKILIKIRNYLLAKGCTIHYGTQVKELIIVDHQVKGVVTAQETLMSEVVVLAIGHSSRSLVRTLVAQEVAMEKKMIAVGLRIEHHQAMINQMQYHGKWQKSLPAANYQVKADQLYSFCMCPGGEVINASSEVDGLTTNGMSYSHRNGVNANSALIQQFDVPGDVLANLEYLQSLEQQAFVLGGSNHQAPVQLVQDYLNQVPSTKIGKVIPSIRNGYRLTDLSGLFNPALNEVFRTGLKQLSSQLPGFVDEDTILTGVETRVTSPVRILREVDSLVSTNTKGLYPCGEGAGYAGGIMSSAIDGVRVAQAIISTYQPKD
jgi:uncharacterized protein